MSTRLIKIADWTGEKRGNVVFVHGLGGHPYDTWQRNKSDVKTLWPPWLAEDIPGLAVFSLGYVSPASNWLGTAMPLLDEAAHVLRVLMNSQELKTGPITFVCHSLGGLIVKDVLRKANEQKQSDPEIADFFDRCRQVIFIATPHTGSGQATWMEWLSWLAWPSASVRNLVANAPELRDLNLGYRTLAEGRAANLHHLVYYEMVDTPVGRVVSPASADPGLPNSRPTPIREDHIDIAKPRRRDDLIYIETKRLIEHLAPEPNAPGELRTDDREPFTIPWSWKPLVPKLVRVAALGVIGVLGWQGVTALRAIFETKEVAVDTRDAVKAQGTKLDDVLVTNRQILLEVSREKGVPLATLRAILASMGDAAETLDKAEIEKKLKAKAVDYKALSDRLNRLTSDDPEVTRLRQAAQKALKNGRFEEANAYFEAAKARDRATLQDLEANVNKKRLSMAETASVQAEGELLQFNPKAYRRAAELYAEAASIAEEADSKVARDYAYQQGKTLIKLGKEFGQNAALQEARAFARHGRQRQ